ncbi:MAG: hypothetical protein GYB68_13585 [Chloroflexi bacterium]|nr:hypothetical protein [Chloroflexota bacterium]
MQPTYDIEVNASLGLVIVTIKAEFSIGRELPTQMEHLTDTLDELGRPVYVIFDVRDLRFTIGDVVQASNDFTNRSKAGLLHPNLYMALYISDHPVIKIAAKGLQNEIFGGGIRTAVFNTVDDALDYAQANPPSPTGTR